MWKEYAIIAMAGFTCAVLYNYVIHINGETIKEANSVIYYDQRAVCIDGELFKAGKIIGTKKIEVLQMFELKEDGKMYKMLCTGDSK